MHDITVRGDVPGLLLYDHEQGVGWCTVGPRENYLALENSRILKRIDAQPVWSVVCFFVTRPYRGKGALRVLLSGAVDYARQQAVKIVDGYPIDMQSPKLAGQKLTSYSGYMGIASIFRAIGFVEVVRASETQLIMHLQLG